jgi:hypothetical protein
MTKVRVDPGQCGMTAVVEVKQTSRGVFELRIISDCEMVRRLAGEVPSLSMADAFSRFSDNTIYRKGAACLKHVACPVPSAILKTLEVEAGFGVPRDVKICFIKDEDQ